MARTNWGFVRDAWNAGLNYDEIMRAGYGGVLFRGDERNLDQLMQKARNAGLKAGVWGAANNMGPEEFARYMASLQKYNPDIYVPDIEAPGKGYQNSPGWDYNERFAKLFRQLAPNAYAAITMEPMQDDYNYKAYTDRGFEVWPQAYNGSMSPYDVKAVVQRAIANGVDPRLVFPVLMGGQSYAGGSYYTLDDMVGKGYITPAQAQDLGRTTPSPTAPIPGVANDTKKLLDRDNPAAIAYSKKRLAQAKAEGLIKNIPKGDPTAAWREVSKAYASPRVILRYGGAPAKR